MLLDKQRKEYEDDLKLYKAKVASKEFGSISKEAQELLYHRIRELEALLALQ
jgi:hypothetical protein